MRRGAWCLRWAMVVLLSGWLSAREAKTEIVVPEMLRLGPICVDPNPDETSKTEELTKILTARLLADGLPVYGAGYGFFGRKMTWERVEGSVPAAGISPGCVLVLSVNLETDRFIKGRLATNWDGNLELTLDGAALSGTPQKGFDASLCGGSHRLLALVWGTSKSETGFDLKWVSEDGIPTFHVSPHARVSAELLFHTPVVRRLKVSPDGSFLGVWIRGYDSIAKGWQERVEIRALDDFRVVRQWIGDVPEELAWSADGAWLAYLLGDDLWLEPVSGGEAVALVTKQEGLSNLRWNPKGQSLFFQWTKKAQPRSDGVKRYRALEDRWATWRDRTQVFEVDCAGGVIRQLTRGPVSHELLDVHRTGTKLLVASRPVDYSRPPYGKMVLKECEVERGDLKDLGTFWALNSAAYIGDELYLLGGPSLLGEVGRAPGLEGPLNDYDGQLVRFNPETGQATALSREFEPSISAIQVMDDGDVLLQVTQRQHVPLYWYRANGGAFEKVDSPATVVDAFSCSSQIPRVLCWSGTSVSTPQRVFCASGTAAPKRVFDPGGDAYANVHLGDVEPFSFWNAQEREIDGRTYLPPDFDPEKKYPLIVYYYGGTSTVEEAFTGRYPFHLWAAHGYVVYVLQPTGTVGYGQAFSAKHVNAWGRYAADDILAGTEAFLARHEYVDPERVGCMGASYGGFMTLYLVTRTDRFAAAISHAGISDLSGYWGKGWWGYLYSGVASRGSFPWNNQSLYVDQSPLFSADRISTPLLLLHGGSDTNVPPEQSHVMFTALKLLGKEVELIEIEGENHLIMDHDKRLVWWNTILAWFDWHLKDQNAWWNALYPSQDAARETDAAANH